MAELKQLDFDFFDTTAPVMPFPKKAVRETEKEPAVEPAELKPETIVFEPVVKVDITDYSGFPANRIYISNEKTILKSGAPPWIPPFSQEFMSDNAFMPPVIKDRDTYLIAASYAFTKMYRLSIDGLAATVDYYTKRQKALNAEEAKEKNIKCLEEAKQWLASHEDVKDEDSFEKTVPQERH